jgi:hypothetical protein
MQRVLSSLPTFVVVGPLSETHPSLRLYPAYPPHLGWGIAKGLTTCTAPKKGHRKRLLPTNPPPLPPPLLGLKRMLQAAKDAANPIYLSLFKLFIDFYK